MILAGDEVYPDEVTSGGAPGSIPGSVSGRSCEVCRECGVACAKTDDRLCWECAQELGGEG